VKNIEFDFAAVGYRRSADIEFQAYLQGFDEHWVDRGTRRTISYTSLPGGEYVMHLRAKYPGGTWPDRWSTLAFTVQPYLWERWPVRIAMAALIVGATIGVIRIRERKIKAEARRDRQLRATISELESRALRSQINPHFIFNSLNGIREAVLGDRTKVASEYLEKFSTLMRNVLENSDRHAVTLDREIETLRLYIDLEQLRFEEPFHYVISVEPSLDARSILIPPMLIQPVVENAIWHGLSTKEGNRQLTITIWDDPDYVRCCVEDNGVGRADTAARHRKRPHGHTPRGTQITRDLIEAFRGEGAGEAGVEILDLYGENGEPAGTRVNLTIPIQA
jgi:LytS/YehU family sensor histidine kinase